MIKQKQPISIVLILLTLALILADWSFARFITFSDIFVITILFILFISNYVKFKRKQFISFYVVLTYLIINFIVQFSMNSGFDVVSGVVGTTKVMIYFSTVIFIYNYVTENQLQIKLMSYLNRAAVIVCIVGLYIYVTLSFDLELPYRFIWTFTRNDPQSYLLGAFTSVIRMRSIFGEPAHLGFFLLMVLGVSYFNNFEFRLSKLNELLIIASVLLSFSLSAIAILPILILLDLIKSKSLFYLDQRKYFILVGLFILMILLFANPTFNIAIVSRVSRIFSGVDTSASVRLLGTWSYISPESFILGNGINNSPSLFNNFAYVITDLGLIGFILFLYFSLKILLYNAYFFILFVLLNFMKGGYLSAGYWVFLFFIVVISFNTKKIESTQMGENYVENN